MKAYGVPRRADLDTPDQQDAADYGMPSRVSKLHAKAKRRTRQLWKKRARIEGKKACESDAGSSGAFPR